MGKWRERLLNKFSKPTSDGYGRVFSIIIRPGRWILRIVLLYLVLVFAHDHNLPYFIWTCLVICGYEYLWIKDDSSA